MDSLGKEPMDIVPGESERGTTDEAHILADNEKQHRERSREYRRRYKQRQKEKDTGMQQRIKEIELELQHTRLEQANLISQANALASLSSYSSSMIETLATAAAAKARTFSDKAKESISSIQNWAQHRWNMLPTAAELIAGTAWTPTDDQMRWVLKALNSREIYANNVTF
jgi:hypothetical protein